jgi:rhomboid protease GluP
MAADGTDKLSGMFKRQRTGSVVCASCGSLVGVNDDKCYSCGRRNPGLWGYGRALRALGHDLGLVTVIMYACIGVYIATLLFSAAIGEDVTNIQSPLSMFGPGVETLVAFGASGMVPVFGDGRWWSFLSAGWLHAGVLHLAFNMMTLRQLGPPTAELYGPARMVIIYIIGGVAGFLCSTLAGYVQYRLQLRLPLIGAGAFTVGASAPIFGLLGGLMYYSRRGGSSLIRSAVMGYVMSAVVMGVLMRGIDNWAHAGGFAGGYLAGIWLDPLKPERMDHMIIAAGCLVASALAIAASLIVSLWPTIMIRFFGAPPAIIG